MNLVYTSHPVPAPNVHEPDCKMHFPSRYCTELHSGIMLHLSRHNASVKGAVLSPNDSFVEVGDGDGVGVGAIVDSSTCTLIVIASEFEHPLEPIFV
jgi:hypothetical protein